MTSERLLNVSIKVFTPKNFYTSPKQISGYAPSGSAEQFKDIQGH